MKKEFEEIILKNFGEIVNINPDLKDFCFIVDKYDSVIGYNYRSICLSGKLEKSNIGKYSLKSLKIDDLTKFSIELVFDKLFSFVNEDIIFIDVYDNSIDYFSRDVIFKKDSNREKLFREICSDADDEKVIIRKLSMIGGYSYSVILPMSWVKKNNVEQVSITEDNDGNLKISKHGDDKNE